MNAIQTLASNLDSTSGSINVPPRLDEEIVTRLLEAGLIVVVNADETRTDRRYEATAYARDVIDCRLPGDMNE